MKILTTALIAFAVLFSTGCTVKQTDSAGLKVAKHTANTPLYVVIGVGAVGTAAFTLAGAAIAYPAKLAFDEFDNNSTVRKQ